MQQILKALKKAKDKKKSKEPEPINNMVFKKYVFVNKSESDIEDMYVSYWMDGDLGDAGNDFVGCDTLLDIGFYYNGTSIDNIYKNI